MLIQLKDGSIWLLHLDDGPIIKDWKKSHKLLIRPAYTSFWPDFMIVYKYVLTNLNLNAEVGIRLASLPEESFRIESIDRTSKRILLNDLTIWDIDVKSDLAGWQEGNRIVIGMNNEWTAATYPQILINGDLNNQPYVSAIQGVDDDNNN